MERFTPLYAIAYAIMNSMENLLFDKEDYFHVFVFYTGYFINEIENISPRVFPYVIETLVEVWENSKCFSKNKLVFVISSNCFEKPEISIVCFLGENLRLVPLLAATRYLLTDSIRLTVRKYGEMFLFLK